MNSWASTGSGFRSTDPMSIVPPITRGKPAPPDSDLTAHAFVLPQAALAEVARTAF